MHIKNKTLAVMTGCAVIAVAAMNFTDSAQAKPRHKRHHHAAQARVMQHDAAPANTAGNYPYLLPGFQSARSAGESRMTASRKHRAARAPRMQTASAAPTGFGASFGSSSLVNEARRFIGRGNPTGRSSLWCARFMNMVLERTGKRGTGSDMAKSFASHGKRISGPQVGAIAVLSRGKRGGHVGVVSGVDASGNPIIISGNHGNKVAEATYPRGRVYAYVMP